MNGAAASGGGGAETKFVMEVETTTPNEDFTINTGYSSGASGINFNVDWGDGSSDSGEKVLTMKKPYMKYHTRLRSLYSRYIRS
ncbi:unnamed protein product [marine sediment metagenome]|uniref:PKD domain-containing protein n=1 Tax=marine sediment metagenome TaxID=412755 RepID=X0ZDV7_9ZZZZ